MSFTAREVDRHMRQAGSYNDWSKTCDTFKAGDPDTVVKKIAVSWMSTIKALRQAQARGCNLFVTHEPTFYSHWDNDPAFDQDSCTREKRSFLAESGMVVYRCHDVWDRFPGEGILDSWAAFLGLTAPPVARETFWQVVPIEPTTAGDVARRVAGRIAEFGQEAALLAGDPAQRVSRVAIGTGAITSAREYHRLGADIGIVTEMLWWREARWAQDTGMPLVVVDHTVSEEPGMINLASYLGRTFADVKVEYLPTHCPFRLVYRSPS